MTTELVEGSNEWMTSLGFLPDYGTDRWTHKLTQDVALKQPYMNDAQWLAKKREVGERVQAKLAVKGQLNGMCGRGVCSNGNADYYNRETQKHYCRPCADKINAAWRFSVKQHNQHNTPFKLNETPLCAKVTKTS